MSYNINVGSAANDRTGDTLRDAFIKINSNFVQIDSFSVQVSSHMATINSYQSQSQSAFLPLVNQIPPTIQVNTGGGLNILVQSGASVKEGFTFFNIIEDQSSDGQPSKFSLSTVSSYRFGAEALLIAAGGFSPNLFSSLLFEVPGILGVTTFLNNGLGGSSVGFNPGVNAITSGLMYVNIAGTNGSTTLFTFTGSGGMASIIPQNMTAYIGQVDSFASAKFSGMYFSNSSEIAFGNANQVKIKYTHASSGLTFATSSNQRISFWGATPIIRPSNVASTSGASVSSLEVEVNNLKKILKDTGLMG